MGFQKLLCELFILGSTPAVQYPLYGQVFQNSGPFFGYYASWTTARTYVILTENKNVFGISMYPLGGGPPSNKVAHTHSTSWVCVHSKRRKKTVGSRCGSVETCRNVARSLRSAEPS